MSLPGVPPGLVIECYLLCADIKGTSTDYIPARGQSEVAGAGVAMRREGPWISAHPYQLWYLPKDTPGLCDANKPKEDKLPGFVSSWSSSISQHIIYHLLSPKSSTFYLIRLYIA